MTSDHSLSSEKVVNKCPRCGSPDPKKHPAMNLGGEVQICTDAWHSPISDTKLFSIKSGALNHQDRGFMELQTRDVLLLIECAEVLSELGAWRADAPPVLLQRSYKVLEKLGLRP